MVEDDTPLFVDLGGDLSGEAIRLCDGGSSDKEIGEDDMASPTDIRGSVAVPNRVVARRIVRVSLWLFEHWVAVFSLVFGAFVIAPFLAPIFMHLGWYGPGQAIYLIYSTMCHQMAQRSFFLFGPQPMYNIAQLPITMTGNEVVDMLALRNFIGSADLGWKVAWSDRMVYLYGGVWLGGLAFGVLRNRNIQPLHWITVALLALPIVVDGGTHAISDFTGGLVNGFRYSNQWLASLTGNTLPSWFYAGDAFGSLNSWARLISGLLFGVARVWLAFPYVDRGLRDSAATLQLKLKLAEQRMGTVEP